MVAIQNVTVEQGDSMLLVGTLKGAFIFSSDPSRRKWRMGGPYFPGHSVYAMCFDGRNGRRRLWAATSSMHWGADLRSSDDYGLNWTQPEVAAIRFPEDSDTSLKQIWQIVPAGPNEPDTLYCGVEPAALFKSVDGGDTWSLERGLFDHPHRPMWQPGGGGLCLHTILVDPQNPSRILVAISTGGVYRTDDHGATWEAKNKGVRAQFLPDKYPEFGQCVHKVVSHKATPDRLFLQNHWGLYRSDDSGDSWTDIANSVPTDFGFAMAADPNEPDTVYTVPIESDEFRCTPEGKLRVFRTRNKGESWEPLTQGLPQQHAFETVLRDGLETDDLSPTGVYFGTRSGKVFGSSDAGEAWSLIADGLPAVTCVKAAVA
jgi:photosystem II stability/assembly factor-like uncharacterized protein